MQNKQQLIIFEQTIQQIKTHYCLYIFSKVFVKLSVRTLAFPCFSFFFFYPGLLPRMERPFIRRRETLGPHAISLTV